MKNVTIIITLLVSTAVFAQESLINSYFQKYEDDQGFTKLTVNKKMFSMISSVEQEDAEWEEFKKAMEGIDGIKILVGNDVANPAEMYKNALSDIRKMKYEELMSVKDAEEDITFVVKEKEGEITELLMLIGGNKNFVLMSIYGIIDLNAMSKFAGAMNIDGMQQLEKLNEGN